MPNVLGCDARLLAEPQGRPIGEPAVSLTDLPAVDAVAIGPMLGFVSIMPTVGITRPVLLGYGDAEVLDRLVQAVTTSRNMLEVTAPLPLHDGSMLPVGPHDDLRSTTLTVSGRTRLQVKNRDVDTRRTIHLVVQVPLQAELQVSNVLGGTGVADGLQGDLHLSGTFVNVYARQCRSLVASLSTAGVIAISDVQADASITSSPGLSAKIGHVHGSATVNLESGGAVEFQEVSKALRIEAGPGNTVTVAGGTSAKLHLNMGPGSTFVHEGAVTSPGQLAPAPGGSYTVNGQTYTWSPFGVNVTGAEGRVSADPRLVPPIPPVPPVPPVGSSGHPDKASKRRGRGGKAGNKRRDEGFWDDLLDDLGDTLGEIIGKLFD